MSGDTPAEIAAYPCPYCHAPAGSQCTNSRGGPTWVPHASRYWLWRDAVDAENPPTPAPEGVWPR